MSDFPLLGCLHDCKILSAASDDGLVLDGPIYTVDKINRNGWGIPSDEADSLARSLEGKPIRYCPQGKPLPGISAEHYCDARGTDKDVVGVIEKVYPAGLDEKGRTIYNQVARITHPATIRGIQSGDIPASWSVFLYARKLVEGMVHGTRGSAASIVSKPAYTEANYEWQRMAASSNSFNSFFTLNKPDPLKPGIMNGDPPMGNEAPNSNQTPPTQQSAGGAPQSVQATLNGMPPVTVNNYYPTAGNAQIPANPKPEGDGKAGETQTPKAGETPRDVYTKEQVDKMIQDALNADKEKAKITGLAVDVAKLQVAAGVLEEKDQDKEVEKLQILGASVLTDEKAKYTKIVDRLKKQKVGENPMSSGVIPSGASAVDALPEGMDEFFRTKLRMNPADYTKYGKSNSRSIIKEVV